MAYFPKKRPTLKWARLTILKVVYSLRICFDTLRKWQTPQTKTTMPQAMKSQPKETIIGASGKNLIAAIPKISNASAVRMYASNVRSLAKIVRKLSKSPIYPLLLYSNLKSHGSISLVYDLIQISFRA